MFAIDDEITNKKNDVYALQNEIDKLQNDLDFCCEEHEFLSKVLFCLSNNGEFPAGASQEDYDMYMELFEKSK